MKENMQTQQEILDKHFKSLTDFTWKAFDDYVTEMMKKNYGMDRMKFREYVLWDMKRRHDEEVNDSNR